jgi:hypothetical protein
LSAPSPAVVQVRLALPASNQQHATGAQRQLPSGSECSQLALHQTRLFAAQGGRLAASSQSSKPRQPVEGKVAHSRRRSRMFHKDRNQTKRKTSAAPAGPPCPSVQRVRGDHQRSAPCCQSAAEQEVCSPPAGGRVPPASGTVNPSCKPPTGGEQRMQPPMGCCCAHASCHKQRGAWLQGRLDAHRRQPCSSGAESRSNSPLVHFEQP